MAEQGGRGGWQLGEVVLEGCLLLGVEEVEPALLGAGSRRHRPLAGDIGRRQVTDGDLQEAVVFPDLDGLGPGGVKTDLDCLADQRVVAQVAAAIPGDERRLVDAAAFAQQEGAVDGDGVELAQGGPIRLPCLTRRKRRMAPQAGVRAAVV